MARQEFATNVVVANEYTLIGAGSQWGVVTVGTAAVELKVGAAALSGRTTIFINSHPDNSGYVYMGIDNTVTAAKYFMVLGAGEKIQIKVDSNDNLQFWAIGSAVGQKVGLLEGIA